VSSGTRRREPQRVRPAIVRYVGNQLRAHEPIHARTPFSDIHFKRWLELFTTTVDEHFIGPTAEVAKQRAAKMAHALRRLLADAQHDPSTSMEPLWTTRTTYSQIRTAVSDGPKGAKPAISIRPSSSLRNAFSIPHRP
jgi:hypothetical protein